MTRILLYLIFLMPLLTNGQETIKVRLDWTGVQQQKSIKGLEVNYYSFEGAVNHGDFGALPLYLMEVPCLDPLIEYEADIEIVEVDTLSTDAAAFLTDADLVGTFPAVRYDHTAKVSRIFVLPFYRGDHLIRLREFNLVLIPMPSEPPAPQTRRSARFADHSVLAAGTWIKMGVTETGVHRLAYDDLLAMGIDPAGIDPARIGIFGNYTGLLPEANNKERPDDLGENDILLMGMEDGRFDEQDYLLFYARGPVAWRYNIFTGRYDHTTNIYADTVYYFFTPDAGNKQRIDLQESTSEQPTEFVDYFIDYTAHEEELENLIYSGKEWFGEQLTGDTLRRMLTYDFPHRITDRPVFLSFELVARGLIHTFYSVMVNGMPVIDSVRINKVSTNSSIYANRASRRETFFSEDEELEIAVQYLTDDKNATAWINYLVLNVERELIFTGGQMGFREPHVTAAGNVTQFEVRQVPEGAAIWEISDPFHPVQIGYNLDDDLATFAIPTDSLKDFIIFDHTAFLQPVSFEQVPNQDLHGIQAASYVIIAPEMFLDQARRLAGLHQEYDGLESVVVTPEQVYNEFSSGSQDVTAIRDFMRMLYSRGAFGNEPGYLMLFGDASYDYKHRVHENTNIIPTYQSDESLRLTGSYVTDDYFGLLDDNEGADASGILDIGIGRFPVSTGQQAKNAVDKIAHYMAKDLKVMRDWRNNLCFVADDGDKNLHMNQAQLLISIADTLHESLNINKIFSDAHTQISVPGGKRYPDVNEKIRKQVTGGAQIVNYTGHGGLIGWSEEMILDVPMIREFSNYDNMPLFITATCEFSRFDDPEFVSAGEYTFLNEKGGGIGLLTTTRLAYAHANIIVNQRIYQNLLSREDGQRPRLGDLIRMSKNPSSNNYLNFALLGDPAMRLSFPLNEVVTETLNNKSAGAEADTVHALSMVTVGGYIADQNGSLISDFNGYLYPKVFDKPSNYTTLGNDQNSYPEDFRLMDKVLFDGKVSVADGRFEFSFMIPKDIAYNYDFGKISYYAVDTVSRIDAWGAYENMYIGGLDETAGADNEGPLIRLYLNDPSFIPGDLTNSSPTLYAEISDEHGVNFTGHSLGRDITMVMDEEWSNSMVVNDYFSLDLDTYQSGKLTYPFDGLDNGWHTITLKAWDLLNNSSENTVDFYVDDAAEILLSGVVNYPNPFVDQTTFGFLNNKTGSVLDVEVRIYDINGKFIGSMSEKVTASGGAVSAITWNGRDQYGKEVPAGFYTYQIIVSDHYGNRTIQRQKMIKMNK